jgi:uncharacterized MnhB-related membrane protein
MDADILIQLIHIVLPILIVISSVFAVILKDLIAAAIAVAAMSLLLYHLNFIFYKHRMWPLLKQG